MERRPIYFFRPRGNPLSLFFRFENMPITVLKDHRPDDHQRTQYLSNFLNVPQISFSHKECSLKSIDLVRGNSLSTERKGLKRKFSYRRTSFIFMDLAKQLRLRRQRNQRPRLKYSLPFLLMKSHPMLFFIVGVTSNVLVRASKLILMI